MPVGPFLEMSKNDWLRFYIAGGDVNLALVRALLDEGADPNHDGGAPLQLAAEKGFAGLAALLVDRGAEINADEGSPLYSAALMGHEETVRTLLRRGASVVRAGGQDFLNDMRHTGASPEINRMLAEGLRAETWEEEEKKIFENPALRRHGEKMAKRFRPRAKR